MTIEVVLEQPVSNPWTKKNPMMSMWLSSANKVMGAARTQAMASAKREIAATQADIEKQVVQFWTGKPTKLPSKKKSHR